MNTDSTKIQLRKKLRAQRQELESADVLQRSGSLSKQLIELIDWHKAGTIHCFLPLQNDNEPDMRELIKHAMNQGWDVYTTDPASSTGRKIQTMQDPDLQSQIQVYELNQLANTSKRPTTIKFDYIVVPMLGFDRVTRHRVGFGGGFYDRFLAQQPHAKKIGVCFTEFAIDNLEHEPHDIPLDEIITA